MSRKAPGFPGPALAVPIEWSQYPGTSQYHKIHPACLAAGLGVTPWVSQALLGYQIEVQTLFACWERNYLLEMQVSPCPDINAKNDQWPAESKLAMVIETMPPSDTQRPQ